MCPRSCARCAGQRVCPPSFLEVPNFFQTCPLICARCAQKTPAETVPTIPSMFNKHCWHFPSPPPSGRSRGPVCLPLAVVISHRRPKTIIIRMEALTQKKVWCFNKSQNCTVADDHGDFPITSQQICSHSQGAWLHESGDPMICARECAREPTARVGTESDYSGQVRKTAITGWPASIGPLGPLPKLRMGLFGEHFFDRNGPFGIFWCQNQKMSLPNGSFFHGSTVKFENTNIIQNTQ